MEYVFQGLRRVYAYIPSWMGGYNGIANNHICARITGVSVEHWDNNEDTCNDLLDQHIISSAVGIGTITMACWMLMFNYHLIQFCFRGLLAHGGGGGGGSHHPD